MTPTTARRARTDVAQELLDMWHRVRRATLERFTEDGLSLPRAKVLWQLEETDALRPSALAGCLEVSAAAVTELVDGLVRDGLATRTPDPSDRRAVLIGITPAGREVARVSMAHKRRIHKEMLSHLTPDEVDLLGDLLERLAASPVLKELS